MKLAFVGLGNMGLPMAINLSKVYPEVYGLNRSKGKEERFGQAGGRVGYSLEELAGQVDILMTCLPLPEDVEQVYLGEDGVLAHGHPGLIAIDFSTVSPELSRRLYERLGQKGIHFLDAPVSGGPPGAEAGTLSIMVGGNKDIFEQVKPVLEVVGRHISYVGPSGSGSAAKLINQLMVGIHTLAVSEGLILAQEFNLNFDQLVSILNNSFAQSRILERHYTQFIAPDQYEPGFALKLLQKDTGIIEQLAEELSLELPIIKQVNQLLYQAKQRGYQDQDMSSMYKFMLEQRKPSGSGGELKYYAAFLPMKDEEKSRVFRSEHLAYLEKMRREGKIVANGRFVDGSGGLVIYQAGSLEEAKKYAENDPYVQKGARGCEVRQWEMVSDRWRD